MIGLAVVMMLSAQQPKPVLVDGVAAVVGTEVITISEVDAEGRVVLIGRAGPSALDRELDDAFRARVLDYIVVQEILALQARREHHVVVRESAVDAALSELKGKLAGSGGLARLLSVARIPEDDVRVILRRDLIVKQLLARVLKDDGPAPAGEVTRYLEAHPALLAGRPMPERRFAAEREYKREARDLRFSRYVEGLRKDTEVRIVANFGER